MRTSNAVIESQAPPGSQRGLTTDLARRGIAYALAVVGNHALGACATKPLVPYSADTPPLVLAPAAQAGVQDKRGAIPRDLLRRAGGARTRDFPTTGPATKRWPASALNLPAPASPSISARRNGASSRRSYPASDTNASSSGSSRPAPPRQHVRQYGYDAIVPEGRCAVGHREQCAADPRRDHGACRTKRERRASC